MKINKRITAYLTSLFFVLAVLFIETISYPGFWQQRTGVSPQYLLVAFLGLNLLMRLLGKKCQISQLINRLSLSGFLLGSLIYFVMYGLEQKVYTNFVFSKTHLHPDVFAWFPIFFLGLLIVNLNLTWLKKHYKLSFLASAWFLLILGAILRLRNKEFFMRLLWEDGPVEYLTCLFSLAAGGLSLAMASKAKQLKQKFSSKWQRLLFQIGFIILGLGLIFVAGEEISWGQRIFNYQTPATISQTNLQDEINLHNHQKVFKYVYYAYAVIGLYGAFSRLVLQIINKLLNCKLITYLQNFTPPSYLMFWFLLIPFYVKLRYTYGIWSWGEFSESGEMYLMFGFFAWTALKLRQISGINTNKAQEQ